MHQAQEPSSRPFVRTHNQTPTIVVTWLSSPLGGPICVPRLFFITLAGLCPLAITSCLRTAYWTRVQRHSTDNWTSNPTQPSFIRARWSPPQTQTQTQRSISTPIDLWCWPRCVVIDIALLGKFFSLVSRSSFYPFPSGTVRTHPFSGYTTQVTASLSRKWS